MTQPMFDPELCQIPICSETPHDMVSLLLVKCRHTGGITVHVTAHDDQVTYEHRKTLRFGPFDELGYALEQTYHLLRSMARYSR